MKKKILFTSILLLFISLLFINNNVFATTYDLSDYKNHLHSGNSWVVVYSIDNDNFYMITSETSNSYIYSRATTLDSGESVSSGYFLFSTELGSNMSMSLRKPYVCTFDKNTNTFGSRTQYSWDDNATTKVIGKCRIIASGLDVHPFNKTEVFFQQTPVPSKVIIGQTTLAEELETAQVKENFQTMMSGIIPYLIALVVGLVAFWKAWQLLLKELRQA